MSMKQKLLGPVIILSLIICSMFLMTWWMSEQLKDDGLVINLAGRQRMLTQKMTKEILYFQSVRVNDEKEAGINAKQAKNTMAVFGKTLTALTNNAFSEVLKSTGKVGSIVSGISRASKEQSNGIEQVNQAVADMDKVVQQNAATAEESAAVAEELNEQAGHLKQYVTRIARLVSGKKDSEVIGNFRSQKKSSIPG